MPLQQPLQSDPGATSPPGPEQHVPHRHCALLPQSASLAQPPPGALFGAGQTPLQQRSAPPPISLPQGVPFSSAVQTPPLQVRQEPQSTLPPHRLPAAQPRQLPPQSTSVSSPFLTPSRQVATEVGGDVGGEVVPDGAAAGGGPATGAATNAARFGRVHRSRRHFPEQHCRSR